MIKTNSALPQDEFALEMRNHFLETTEGALSNLSNEAAFNERFHDLALAWASEAIGNEMPFLATLLKKLAAETLGTKASLRASLICQGLTLYLRHLKENGDAEGHAATFVGDLEGQVSVEPSSTYLQCRRGKYSFLLPVENVLEISRQKKISSLPFSDSKVKGLIGFRGQGTPVLDLAYAGYGSSDESCYFVICEHEKNFFALEVNSTDDVLKLKASDFQSSSDGARKQFTTKDQTILILLDIPKLVAA